MLSSTPYGTNICHSFDAGVKGNCACKQRRKRRHVFMEEINVPADAHDILTVGAVSPNMRNAAFSSVGPTADNRVKPDIMALGSPASVITGRGTIIKDMGTSFSTPVVSGMVACLWQALRDKTALEIIDLVRRCSDNYSTPDNIYGYGVPDFWRAYVMGRQQNRSK